MIRGIFSAAGAVILATLLLRVVQGSMSLMDVALRGLVIVLVISLIDRVIAPMVGAGLRGLNVAIDDDSTRDAAGREASGGPNG
jgi:hypothetical protein